jgi:hypothetical protein
MDTDAAVFQGLKNYALDIQLIYSIAVSFVWFMLQI